MKKILFPLVAAGALAVALAASAQEPAQNIGPRHGNLRAAQSLIAEAYDRITAAQNINNYDLGGHASRAKQLLREASDELRLAADSANQR